MHCFIFKRQPKSYNSGFKSDLSKQLYTDALILALNQFNTISSPFEEDLYGIVYHFYKKNVGIDADNLSKPLWDLLKGIMFKDDKQIKLRIAGSIDISSGDFSVFDFSNLKGEVTAELIEAFDTQDHFLYVECGKLKNGMFKFNIEDYGN
ncbi:RusA family crossover junction endodeoxyribonuclease [uncultured Flavobacterium sp.]|uniref:RusA family crossover junction endodeoxyribonuclease n=1 Tax=uncultured Flavobacterium sp. TaxID=165435 RepID=UPI0027E0490C|nr:RusA family crossover junction endodeoxyribonuclease [uncultured Flavobacterium sp.]